MASRAYGFDEAAAFFKEKSRKRTRDLTKVMASYMQSSTVGRIRSGRLGQKNAPLTKSAKRGSTPLMDRGRFVRRIKRRHSKDYAAVGSNGVQDALLQTGGTITAKRAKKLLIPATPRTRTLQRRFGPSPGDTIAGLRKAGYRVWFLDNAVIAQRRGKKGFRRTKPFVLYIRKKSVTVPAYQPYRIDSRDEREIMRLVEAWLDLK